MRLLGRAPSSNTDRIPDKGDLSSLASHDLPWIDADGSKSGGLVYCAISIIQDIP